MVCRRLYGHDDRIFLIKEVMFLIIYQYEYRGQLLREVEYIFLTDNQDMIDKWEELKSNFVLHTQPLKLWENNDTVYFVSRNFNINDYLNSLYDL